MFSTSPLEALHNNSLYFMKHSGTTKTKVVSFANGTDESSLEGKTNGLEKGKL